MVSPPLPKDVLDDYEAIARTVRQTRRWVAERALRQYLRPGQEGGDLLELIRSVSGDTLAVEILRVIRRGDE